jgi:hypothetical protein
MYPLEGVELIFFKAGSHIYIFCKAGRQISSARLGAVYLLQGLETNIFAKAGSIFCKASCHLSALRLRATNLP